VGSTLAPEKGDVQPARGREEGGVMVQKAFEQERFHGKKVVCQREDCPVLFKNNILERMGEPNGKKKQNL